MKNRSVKRLSSKRVAYITCVFWKCKGDNIYKSSLEFREQVVRLIN